jgi:hypothetical protein
MRSFPMVLEMRPPFAALHLRLLLAALQPRSLMVA